jgi:hypothetical protein
VSRGLRVEHDDGLAVEHPVLGAAEAEHVDAGVGGERPQWNAEARRRVGDARSVHVQLHAERVHVVGDGPDLVDRVGRAELGGLGDRDDERLRPVLVSPAPGLSIDQLRGEFAVGRLDGQELDAGDTLGSPGLIGVDVRGLGAHHRTPAGDHRLEPDDVGAGAVEHREHLNALTEVLGEHIVEPCGVDVVAVGDLVALVGRRDGVEDLGMHSRVVVGGEAAEGEVVEL